MSIEELASRDYDGGLPMAVCNAAYDTIKRYGYKHCFVVCDDANLRDWLNETKSEISFEDSAMDAPARLDFVFWSGDVGSGDIAILAKRIKKGGQMAFYNAYEVPLRAFFNHPGNWEKWMTAEVPLADGLFIAKKI